MKNLVLLATVTAGLNLALMSSANGATYGGDATGAVVTVTATGTTIRAATNSLSISGGEADAALSVGDIPGSATGGVVTLAASALSSVVIGTGADTRAHAAMGAVGLTVSGNQISSDFLMARSNASCGPSVAGSSELVNLVINGQPITVTGAANQTVTLSNGSVVINEQVPTVGGTSGELIVYALHVLTHDTITGQPIADVALGNADAKIDCAAGWSPGENWVSGAGWIPGAGGSGKATFGFVAGPGGQPNRGHLTLKDHSTGETVHGTVIFNFTECLSGQSHFEGNDQNGFGFQVDTADNADPGAGRDTFTISGAYSNPGPLLGGGNIQDHGFLCQ
ncbi:MAG: hypothetical protein E6H43_07315 [Betaproteobacteria bacterium]|nr:MAG: hypothetical protein E6H43_07315 [Betaproteobacteria bacterium]